MNYRLFRSNRAKMWVVWGCVLVALLALRLGWILYERSRPVTPQKQPAKRIQRDYLVRLPRFYIADFEEAKRLVGKSLWVKKGFQLAYHPVLSGRRSSRESGGERLLPLEKLIVKDVVEQPTPGRSGYKEVLVLFDKEGVEVGAVVGRFDGQRQLYQMYLDNFFYAKDPREIYEHWNESTWKLIENHQLELGMTFAQVALSIGDGTLVTREAGDIHLYEFTRQPGGEVGRCRVRFREGRVTEFKVLN